ncbi:phosphatidylinositol-specific phospholipase C [Colletotrichum graminicola]|uniref:Phosphatidylinositol-specific phospholipase C n=1 Tax=Colletotrichum graminicola (strain M1.001 / M2 / FGSC 10212) TaxID=645133 RepID=E3QJF4_COLGM|nr:phosphatidylinositol-specific phospholipase C [Colletotrichum graminicola M1.001]EFQ30992.1 phosphatidylinositol-specific phospholipase C [Colletotrichum graminicola M1.001]WDK17289.1 phosphatidylinositol-specific phospholipase C [Colletotrichum graminicola]
MRFHCMPLLYIVTFFVLISGLFSVLLSLAPCFVKSKNHCYRGYESHFSFDVDRANHAEWMRAIPDDTNLTSLSIPGTHDTMTFDLSNEVFQCQNHNLSAQLHAGMRYLDIRGRLVNDTIGIYHGSMSTGYSYTDVLLTVFSFLDQHPSETVVMRLKEEGRPIGSNTMTFEDAFNFYLHNSTATAPGAKAHFRKHNPRAPYPALGALRGKVFLLQNFAAKGPESPYGVIWESADMVLEDLWIIPSIDHLYMKWEAIENALRRAATAKERANRVLYLAHLSASVGVLPIEAAAGNLNRTVAGMNDRTGDWLAATADRADSGKTGVVIIDFPGKELVDQVLARNRMLTGRSAEL